MTDDEGTLGQRLKRMRRERSLSQEELAELAGVSADLIAKLEQGRRTSARLSSLAKLGKALDVDLSALLGKRPHLDRRADGASLLAVRDALTRLDHLPGIDDDIDTEPGSMDDLRGTVARAWADYWTGRFEQLTQITPALIGQARATYREVGPAAAGLLAQAYQLAACLMVHFGKDDIAMIGAERAIRAAAEGDDEYQWATVHGTASWVLLHQGRLEEAEQLAARLADRIEPSFSAPAPQIAAWGNLLMTALAPAAAAGHDVSGYVSMATGGAETLGRRVDVYETAFGPASVAMQAVHAYAVMKEPGKALKAAQKIRPGELHGISHGRHLLDVAQAQTDARYAKAAVATLQRAHTISPVWFRNQGIARALVTDLVESERRLTQPLRSLARTVGVD